MEYSKLFFFFFLFIVLVNAIPIPKDEVTKSLTSSNTNEGEGERDLTQKEINDMAFEIIDNVSDSLQDAFKEELKPENANEVVNKTINDIVNKNSDNLLKIIQDFIQKNIKNGNIEKMANDAAAQIAIVLDEKIIPSITDKIKIDENFEKFTKDVLDNAGKNIHNFIENAFAKTKEFTDNLNINSSSDISSIITNGIGYLIKKTLCKSLGHELSGVCENISTTIIVNITEILNGIVRTSINAASGNSISVACNVIPTKILGDLSHIIVNTITKQISDTTHNDTEQAQKITNNIISIITNTIENLLCGKVKNTDMNVINRDPNDIAVDLIDRFNNISKEVITNLNNGTGNKNGSENTLADKITKDIHDIQKTMKNDINFENYELPAEFEQYQFSKITEPFNGKSIITGFDKKTEGGAISQIDLAKSDLNQPIINFNAPVYFYVVLNKDK
ncbi:hypothetical protein BCR32DRAFT_275953 [Anaeromyces robustus]|uniref:Uncharacterized protein n=1 Tax=Anaeromyces robustus TaxID=1754192 RepID=A0A1Y1XJD5_9FUNG|nr:hypothetical protein BCR32DRAFT_275953 [Anaeromyces robustus]|eukprot:ORX85867.1 hypothetical protein BCR32DRAFT_275953 [Anaeromyces robustus]